MSANPKGRSFKSHQESEQIVHYKKPEYKKSRFASHEILIVVVILLLVIAIVFPMIVKYVDQAEKAAMMSHGKSIWILTTSSLLLDDPEEKDLEKFSEKYKKYQKFSELENGTLILEKSIMSRVKRFETNDLYVKMEIIEGELTEVSVANDADGKDEQTYTGHS